MSSSLLASSRRSRAWFANSFGLYGLGMVWLLTACPEPEFKPDAPSDPLPRYVDTWKEVINVPFDIATVKKLTVGGPSVNDNFANRGDIAVYFTESNRIRVKMRRIALDKLEDKTQAIAKRTNVWAYAIASPKRPAELSEADKEKDCTAKEWLDNCLIVAYYDGALQKESTATDFQVFLPKAWRGDLKIYTEDFLYDGDNYPNRGDVVVQGFSGRVEIDLDSGVAQVERAADGPLALDCTEDKIAACQASKWDITTCMCKVFPTVSVESLGAANVFINYNGREMIGSARGRNDDDSLPKGNVVGCNLEVLCKEFADCTVTGQPNPWRILESFINTKSLINTSVGMTSNVILRGCEEVSYADSKGETKIEARGFAKFCGVAGQACPTIAKP